MSSDNTRPGLFAAFFEMRKDDERVQWFLAPPFDLELNGGATWAVEGAGRFIKRRLTKPGHRAKWATTSRTKYESVQLKLENDFELYLSTGWTPSEPIVIQIELDDYTKMWEGKNATTPYKALRQVEAFAKKRGYRLTGE